MGGDLGCHEMDCEERWPCALRKPLGGSGRIQLCRCVSGKKFALQLQLRGNDPIAYNGCYSELQIHGAQRVLGRRSGKTLSALADETDLCQCRRGSLPSVPISLSLAFTHGKTCFRGAPDQHASPRSKCQFLPITNIENNPSLL